jgi:hypothetical protein
MTGSSGSNSALVITLGLFLKLLGLFVVLVSYADFEPLKTRKVEYSLQDRFGINLTSLKERHGTSVQAPMIVQQLGSSYDAIEKELTSQMDFLSTEDIALSDRLMLSFPARIALSIDNVPAKSPDFASSQTKILQTQKPANYHYIVTITGQNGNPQAMMRALGDFVQKMIAAGYAANDMSIGYAQTSNAVQENVVIEIQAVSL